MGGPGSGKGTQCKYMATKYGLCHVGLGQLLRQEAQRGTQRGRQIHDFMLQGLLVPTGIILDMVSDNMLSHPECQGFLIDGFPRELKQAQEFERIVSGPKVCVCVRMPACMCQGAKPIPPSQPWVSLHCLESRGVETPGRF
ncbi:adenylate kinase isoenzyme 1-like [Nycticebus coucang]|uniref:adenylate kinase isoenzyme 1-like n=1 Tax=Nycticebus coucang TaxID=9470 RepID=UPI00234DA422|nr:adenylate kinase isoenzyme 1-like [Nycticebus coucang]